MSAQKFQLYLEFPKLIGNISTNKNLTETWRYKYRKKIKNIFNCTNDPNFLINKIRKEDKNSLLKDIIVVNIPQILINKKNQRNIKRNELTKIGIKKNYPQDIINNIIKFLWY